MARMLFNGILLACLCAVSLAGECKFPTQEKTEAARQLRRLSSLLDETFTVKYLNQDKQLEFKFRLCDVPSNSLCNEQPHRTLTAETPDKSCTMIGEYDKSFIVGDSNWVTMAFSAIHANQTYESTITFVCNPAGKEGLRVIYPSWDNQQVSHYNFVFNTKSLCEQPLQEGLSGGSVFCIIFFTVTGVYFLFGFLYQRLVVRAKGVEQIPNYDKWKEFGNLIADGCDYMCRCGGRQEAKMYQGIGDGLGTEESEAEERDDRLLPM